MEKQQFLQLVEKYLAGSASESERELLEEYLLRMDETGETVLNEAQSEKIKQAMWLQIKQRAGTRPAKVIAAKWYQTKVFRLSAIAAAACAILFFTWNSLRINKDLQTITVAEGHAIKKVKLADGTLVWIKPNSSLTFPVAFKRDTREIDLKGEALFEVSKDAKHPFVVHCNDIDVRVLGTSFNIRDFKGRDTVEVAVLTGRVWVNPLEQPSMQKEVLVPNERLRFNRQTGWTTRGIITSSEEYTAGTAYDMHFVNVPVDSIARKIEEKFDVIVQIEEHHNACRVNGNFTDQPLTYTIDDLCKSLEASFTVNRDTIRISGLKCE